jgi:hypothetical protein
MRASTAYFVGAGTIVAAITIGLGGGIVAGNIMNPIAPKQRPDTSRVAQRVSAAAPAATNAPSERVQYLTGSQSFGAMVAAPAQARDETKTDVKPDAATTHAKAEPPAPPPAQTAAVQPPRPMPSPSAQVTAPAEQQASTEPTSSADNAYAKASSSDVKRAASERRRAERHERWADRRRYDPREGRDQTDWNDVARNIREDSDARVVVRRSHGSFPQIRMFDDDDD